MGDMAELLDHGLINFRPPMPVDIHPKGRNPIQIAMSMDINEIAALPCSHNKRLLIDPIHHLGKRMPDVLFVQIFEFFWIVLRQHLIIPHFSLFHPQYSTIPWPRPDLQTLSFREWASELFHPYQLVTNKSHQGGPTFHHSMWCSCNLQLATYSLESA